MISFYPQAQFFKQRFPISVREFTMIGESAKAIPHAFDSANGFWLSPKAIAAYCSDHPAIGEDFTGRAKRRAVLGLLGKHRHDDEPSGTAQRGSNDAPLPGTRFVPNVLYRTELGQAIFS